MVVFHLSIEFSAGCAGGRCGRRARPGKGPEGRLPLRVLRYYITCPVYCKVKLYGSYRVFRSFCPAGAKKYRPRLWAARWGRGRARPGRGFPSRRRPGRGPPSRLRLERRGGRPQAHPGSGKKALRRRPQRRLHQAGTGGKAGRKARPHSPASPPAPEGRRIRSKIVPQPPPGRNRKFPSRPRDFSAAGGPKPGKGPPFPGFSAPLGPVPPAGGKAGPRRGWRRGLEFPFCFARGGPPGGAGRPPPLPGTAPQADTVPYAVPPSSWSHAATASAESRPASRRASMVWVMVGHSSR